MSRQKKVLHVARRLIWLYVLLALGYWVWRFDVQTLPAEGCSPLMSMRPGARLLFDMRASKWRVGDTVLFEGNSGELLVGRIDEPPLELPPQTHWVVTDNPECPGPDSRTLGAIPAERCVGRMLFVLPFG